MELFACGACDDTGLVAGRVLCSCDSGGLAEARAIGKFHQSCINEMELSEEPHMPCLICSPSPRATSADRSRDTGGASLLERCLSSSYPFRSGLSDLLSIYELVSLWTAVRYDPPLIEVDRYAHPLAFIFYDRWDVVKRLINGSIRIMLIGPGIEPLLRYVGTRQYLNGDVYVRNERGGCEGDVYAVVLTEGSVRESRAALTELVGVDPAEFERGFCSRDRSECEQNTYFRCVHTDFLELQSSCPGIRIFRGVYLRYHVHPDNALSALRSFVNYHSPRVTGSTGGKPTTLSAEGGITTSVPYAIFDSVSTYPVSPSWLKLTKTRRHWGDHSPAEEVENP